MKRFVLFATMSLALLVAVTAMAGDVRSFQLMEGNHGVLTGGSAMEKASRDTLFILGGPNRLDGKFQDAFGNANWQGWTHEDLTFAGVQRWNVSDFNVPAGGGTLAMWCGQHGFEAPCGSGYGNGWNENLVFTYTVANPAVNTVLGLECIFNYDTEEGYDYFRIQQNRGGTWEDVISYTGLGSGSYNDDITYTPSDYVGPSANQVEVRFLGVSDSGWSDEDCLYDTNGLAQVDNIRVTIGANVWYEDHEDGDNDYWVQVFNPGVGDYAKIWVGLQEIDACRSNYGPQVAFIDDGIVVPGTGGTSCVTWCYGPGGYIVNNTGGLAGPAYHLENPILSPILAWPTGYDGGIITFDVYNHEDLITGPSPGMFWAWHVRSTASTNPADIADATWKNRNLVQYGRNYVNFNNNFSDLLTPNRQFAQIRLQVIEYGWVWGWEGVDGTPAPYFDNVAVRVFPLSGPSISARSIDIANDNFPELGDLDLANLANNWCRFDMANTISPDADLFNNPGDSIFVDISLARPGSVFNNMPKLVVKMKANPLFDDVRVLPANFTQNGEIIDGWVYGDSTYQTNGTLVANRYNFDLPDSNFWFPGDIIHYYIEAKDNLGGDVGTTTLPRDISHIGDFGGLYPYGLQSDWIVRALPTLFDVDGNQPRILFWNDYENRGGENEWYSSLNALGYNLQLDYDIYYTHAASSGIGNGLGGRATSQTIGGYETLLYSSGDLSAFTLSNNDYANDPSNDIGVVSNWFLQGGKKAFFTGDDIVSTMTNSGQAALAFMNSYFSTRFINTNILPLINNQTAPVVKPLAGNSVFTTPTEWIAFGGCLSINDFDAIETNGTAERLAQFMTPSGDPGYSYAAALRYTNAADVIVLPYDFSFIYNTPTYVPSVQGYTVRTEVLRDVLIEFGHIAGGDVIDVPDGDLVFGVSNYPNPFNPATEIKLTLPQAGHVSLKVFNVRGELVRTLVNGDLPQGPQSILWNGTTDSGSNAASGVYFYEAKYNGETVINKMALVK